MTINYARSEQKTAPSRDTPAQAVRLLSQSELSAVQTAVQYLGGQPIQPSNVPYLFQIQEHRVEFRSAVEEQIRRVIIAVPLFPAERENGIEAILALLSHLRSIHHRSALGLTIAINPTSHLVELLLPVMTSELNADVLKDAISHLTEQARAITQALA